MERRMKLGGGAAVALTAFAAATRLLSLLRLHPLNWDEIEYFRDADWIRQGLVPYIDFWEHHTPLQWFLFAPITAWARSPGVAAIIAMRVAQIPLWLVTFYAIHRLLQGEGVERGARWAATATALCSSLFMLAAVEFRVDVLACALYMLALLCLQRQRFAPAGVLLALAGLANIRFGPLLAATVLVAPVVSRQARRLSAVRLLAGIIGTLACAAIYFVLTHSAAMAWKSVWVDNYIGEKLAPRIPNMLLHRLATPFGLRLLDRGGPSFALESIDLATIIILILGTAGAVRVLVTRWRSPDVLWSIAVLQIVNLAFLARMKFIYNYHFEIVVVMMLPLLAAELARIRWRLPAVALLVALNFVVVVFRGKEDDLRYQDTIMREADRATPADGRVFDGVGWALHRRPAYRYWFLRAIVNVLESSGRFEPYRPAPPPAAFISDYGARVWLGTHPALRGYFTTHYIPVWRDLWLPAMSGVIAPGGHATWTVPADGDYDVFADAALADHPWFHGRIDAVTRLRGGKRVTLRRGMQYSMVSTEPRPLGVFIVPAGRGEIFLQPPQGADIDGAPPPRWHIPRW